MRAYNSPRVWVLLLIAAALLFVSDSLQSTSQPHRISTATKSTSSTTTSDESLHKVVRVVDGDTIIVDMSGAQERVRLIGINTPETVDPRKLVECFGIEASNKAEEMLAGRSVRVVLDPSQGDRDKYGRLLAYLYRDDGLFFNQYMIEEGYAYEYTFDLPYKHQSAFKAAQKGAESQHKGLWAPGVCE